jgi:prefoldin subunit 4
MQGLLKKEDETEVEVRWEDQKKINEFGRNNAKLDELREDMKKIEVHCWTREMYRSWSYSSIQDKMNQFDDANTELMMADGDDSIM